MKQVVLVIATLSVAVLPLRADAQQQCYLLTDSSPPMPGVSLNLDAVSCATPPSGTCFKQVRAWNTPPPYDLWLAVPTSWQFTDCRFFNYVGEDNNGKPIVWWDFAVSCTNQLMCPPPPPVCSDGVCNGTEDANSCPADCGPCGNVSCLNQVFTIRPRHSNKCLGVAAASLGNGAQLIQWSCSGTNEQKFRFEALGYGFHNIRPVHSGKCVAIGAASTANGATAKQWDCLGSTEQQFSVQKTANGYYRLVAKHSGKCLGVAQSSYNNGAEVVQWTCADIADQQFRLVP